MSNIKIFVSHRRDMISSTIKNPLYVNVVCGQALAEAQKGKIGDNTGDNISEKAPYYCELSVQYWAWKNQDADYYGLCHYRRYLSFANKIYPEWNEQRFAFESKMKKSSLCKYGLLNPKQQKKEIEKYDIITSVTYDVKNIRNTPKFKNVEEAFAESPSLMTSHEHIDKLRSIVKNKYPQYYQSLIDELKSEESRGFNCFIMKKQLFNLMCSFQFDILFEMEKTFDLQNRVGNSVRELGYLGEILYSTFIRWAITQEKYKIKEVQIVLYGDTHKKQKTSKLKKTYYKIKNKINQLFGNSKRIDALVAAIQQQNQAMAVLRNGIDTMNLKIEQQNWQNNLLFFSLHRDFSEDLDAKKMQFWKSFPKATGDLRIIQQAQTVLLKDFQRICQKQNCQFWLHGGSLVGGLRHSGFVPWDDDIDIAMMRDDFIKIKNYLFQNSKYYTVKNYYYQNLGCVAHRFQRKDINPHLFIDIFVYDNYSLRYEDALTDWKYLCHQKKRILQQIKDLETSFGINPPSDDPLEKYPEFREKLDMLYDMYISYNVSNEKSEYILWNQDNNYENETRYAWHHGRIFKKEDIFPFKKVVFEGLECNVPANYEKYSFSEYGIRYLDTPPNFGQSMHVDIYFQEDEQIELAQKIIKEGPVVED